MRSPRQLRVSVRLGLRDRVTIAFGLIALGLSVGLSLATWTWVSQYLVKHEESIDLAETRDDAAGLEAQLRSTHRDLGGLLSSVPERGHTAAMLDAGGRWYTTLPRAQNAIPADLAMSVDDRHAAGVTSTLDGQSMLIVGTPMARANDTYYEAFPLTGVDDTMKSLKIVLVVSGIVAVAVGSAIGRMASRRALRPLTELTAAAQAVASGRLSARMPETKDPDLAELASSFNATADAFQRRVVADAHFAADVSHELRTPVTTMVNSMQLIQASRDSLPPEVREPVDLLVGDLARFRGLVVDLLEISREDAADDSTREPVDVSLLVSRAADNAAGRPVTVVDGSAEGVVVCVDKRRVERIVANLVDNADRHGGGCRRTLVEADADSVSIVVEDGGPGVLTQQRDRIFDRFARLRPGQTDGVGLGLAIVARHVRFHQGTVEVDERPGGGARFTVTLPRRP